MTADPWTAVDTYFEEKLLPSDPVLEEALRASEAGGLPSIQVSPTQGKLLHLLAKAQGVRTILEVGTLGGYSTIWLGRALPKGGRLLTLEVDPKHAKVARANLARAGLESKVEVLLGPALETLPKLLSEHGVRSTSSSWTPTNRTRGRTFDWAVRLSRAGSLIVVDNVVRKGELANAASDDPNVRGMRAFLEALASDRRVSATGIQTVGTKGYDGFVLARVLDGPRK